MKAPMLASFNYNSFLLSSEDTQKLLDILSRSREITDRWTDSEVKINGRPQVNFETFPEQKFKDITQAQILGMTYEEYLNAQRESKESLPEDQVIPSEPE